MPISRTGSPTISTGLAANVTRCIATGVAGLSIEDSPNDGKTPLYDLDTAVARVKAARAAIDRAGGDVVFTARAEGFIRGVPDLDDVIRRLKAYAAAGADCLYAPGIKTREQIEAVVKAVAPKPVNFLNSGAFGFTVSDLAAMGVRRISVGGSLARVAMHAFIRTATEIAKDGKFDGFAGLISNPELNKFFREDRKKLLVMTASEPHPTDRPADRPAGRRSDAGAASRAGDAERAATAVWKSSAPNTPPICGRRSPGTTRCGPISPPTGRSSPRTSFSPSSTSARRRKILTPMPSSTHPTAPSAI